MAALALVATAGLAAAACSSSGSSGSSGMSGSSSTPAASAPSSVSTHSTQSLGVVFTDASGRTLYAADQEAGGKITCTGGCLQFWHPVKAATSGSATNSGGFGHVARPDNGMNQLTYKGRPAYTFAEDTGPGDTHGNNVHDAFGGMMFTWHALAVNAAATPSSPSSGGSGTSGGGYGY